MKVEERPVIQVPKTEKVYIANDGKEFPNEEACLKHDNILELKKKISHIPHKRVDVIDCLESGDAYYITNENDFNAVCRYQCAAYPYGFKIDGNWDYRGENWYVFYSVDGGDYADELYCYNLDYYNQLIESFKKQFVL